MPLGSPRRIFARPARRRLVPWLVMILCIAGASAAAGAMLANGVTSPLSQ